MQLVQLQQLAQQEKMVKWAERVVLLQQVQHILVALGVLVVQVE
jgi:hypothetical protein